MIEEAIAKITSLQPTGSNAQGPVWMVGEQLKDLCRACETVAEILLQDLDVPEMSLEYAEKQIKAYAQKNRGCCPTRNAEEILRKFYGLPARVEFDGSGSVAPSSMGGAIPEKPSPPMDLPPIPPKAISVDLDDFLS